MSIKAKIVGTGMYVPETVLSNYDLEKIVDTNDEWITTRTGIKERRVVPKEDWGKVMASDLGVEACRQALQNASMDVEDIDLIICATFSQDKIIPSTACIIQDKLGIRDCAAFDIQAACSGFLYGLNIAKNFIETGAYKNILIVGPELLSRYMDWTDRTTCILFGDGAGAVIVSACNDGSGVLASTLGADGSLGELLYTPLWGDKKLKMNGNETFKHAVKRMCKAAVKTLEIAGISPEDISLLIPHQANIRIIEAIMNRLKLDKSKVMINIEKYGNTSSATIPIALHEALQQGRIKSGDILLMVAFGSGFTWGACVIKW
ncbi:MAG: beta-ketoacyl-ACP synthase III [bacterium]